MGTILGPEDKIMDLGKKIETLRKQKGITQEELAYKLQVSRQSVFKWECGESNPTIDNLKVLSKIFDTTIDFLLDDSKGIDGKDIKITTPTKYRTTFDSKIKFDAQIFADLVNGYEHYSKPLSQILKDRYSEKNDTVMNNYKDCEVIRVVHDTPCYFVIDKKNRNLIVIYHFAEQFICPIENISSVQVSDSGVRNNISRIPVSGGAISTSGRIGIMGGSAPLSTVGNPLIWTITITYFTKNGDVSSYSLSFNSRRSYVLTKEWNLAGPGFEMYTDSISQETQKRLLDVKQTIEAYTKQEVDTSSLKDNDLTGKMTKATLENKLISNVVDISLSKKDSNDRKYFIKSVLISVGVGILVTGGLIGIVIFIMYGCGIRF